jgi:hypothetical protein
MDGTVGTCPRCGGTQRRILAPGFFECTTQTLTGVAPHRDGSGGVPIYRACGHQYQDAPPGLGALCECGLGAVGACKSCGKPLCGRHGTSHDSGFLCYEHWEQAERQAAIEEERARLAREPELARQRTNYIIVGVSILIMIICCCAFGWYEVFGSSGSTV